MERLQREFPETRLVKAFNSVGNALMVGWDLVFARVRDLNTLIQNIEAGDRCLKKRRRCC